MLLIWGAVFPIKVLTRAPLGVGVERSRGGWRGGLGGGEESAQGRADQSRVQLGQLGQVHVPSGGSPSPSNNGGSAPTPRPHAAAGGRHLLLLLLRGGGGGGC